MTKHCLVIAAAGLGAMVSTGFADEHLFGYVRGAETLPKGHADVYQFATLRTGKSSGDYYGWDFDTEAEYGITDKLQVGLAIVQHYFDIQDVPELDDGSFYKFGGVELKSWQTTDKESQACASNPSTPLAGSPSHETETTPRCRGGFHPGFRMRG